MIGSEYVSFAILSPDHGVLYAAVTHTKGSTEYLAGNSSDKVLGSGAVTYTGSVMIVRVPGRGTCRNSSEASSATATLRLTS